MEKYYYFMWSVDGRKLLKFGIAGNPAKFDDLAKMNATIAAVLSIYPTAKIKKYQVRLVTTQID